MRARSSMAEQPVCETLDGWGSIPHEHAIFDAVEFTASERQFMRERFNKESPSMTLQQEEQAVTQEVSKLKAFWQRYGSYVLNCLIFVAGIWVGHKL